MHRNALKTGSKEASALQEKEGRKPGGFSGFVVLASWRSVNAIRYCKQSLESLTSVQTCMPTKTCQLSFQYHPSLLLTLSDTHTHKLTYNFIDPVHRQLTQ